MKKWRWLIIIVVLAAAGAGGYLYVQRNRAKAAGQTQYQTAKVEKGNLVVTVQGSGTIQARKQLNLAFGVAGRVKSVSIQAGDAIKEGQDLIALDTSDLEANLAKAKLNVATAKVQLKKVQTGSTEAEVAAAQAQVKSAEENLARVKAGPTAADLASARAAVATAQQALKTLTDGPTADDLQQAKMRVDQAKNSLWASQSSRDATKGNPNAGGAQKNSAEAGVLNAELNVQLAEMELQQLQQPAKAAEIQDARAKVAQAQEALTKLEASPTAADVAAAEAQLAQAKASLDNVTEGATQDDIDIAQAQVDLAQVAVAQAEKDLTDAVLRAPYDAMVLTVDVSLGDWASDTQVVAVIADMSSLELEAPLSEIDVVRVEQGQQAMVEVSALTDSRLPAHVERVAPAASISQGVANYMATIALDKTDPKVRSGMSANVTIIADRREGVLLAPNRAVRTRGADRVVAVLKNGADRVAAGQDRRLERHAERDRGGPDGGAGGGVQPAQPAAAGRLWRADGRPGGGGVIIREVQVSDEPLRRVAPLLAQLAREQAALHADGAGHRHRRGRRDLDAVHRARRPGQHRSADHLHGQQPALRAARQHQPGRASARGSAARRPSPTTTPWPWPTRPWCPTPWPCRRRTTRAGRSSTATTTRAPRSWAPPRPTWMCTTRRWRSGSSSAPSTWPGAAPWWCWGPASPRRCSPGRRPWARRCAS